MWRVLLPLGLLVLIGISVDGPRVTGLLLSADPVWLVTAFVVVQFQIVLSALRWQLTASRLGQAFSTSQVISEYYIASLLNQVLPGGVTGDAARIFRNRSAGGAVAVAQGVVIERLAGQVALLAVCLSGLMFWPVLVGTAVPENGLTLVLASLRSERCCPAP